MLNFEHIILYYFKNFKKNQIVKGALIFKKSRDRISLNSTQKFKYYVK